MIPVCVLEGLRDGSDTMQTHELVLSVLSVCPITPCELVSFFSKLRTF